MALMKSAVSILSSISASNQNGMTPYMTINISLHEETSVLLILEGSVGASLGCATQIYL